MEKTEGRYRCPAGATLVAALLLGGCASAPAPAPCAVAAAPLLSAPAPAEFLALIGPPPAADSEEQRQDLAAVLEAQRLAHLQHATDRAIADAQPSCARFADVTGPLLAAPAQAEVLAFLDRTAAQASGAVGAAKLYWHRARPYVLSAAVERLADVRPADRAVPNDQLSYPSGHAAFGAACAILLAQILPEQRAALFARGREYGRSRSIVGAHFPTDIEAGRLTGTAAMAVIERDAKFRTDLAQATVALRAALGLPPITSLH